MRRRNEVDVVTTACLQLQHHLRQTLVSHFVFELLFVRLRDLVVLTVNTAKIAIAEENVAGAFGANERRFLAEVCCVRRNDRKATGVTGGDVVI